MSLSDKIKIGICHHGHVTKQKAAELVANHIHIEDVREAVKELKESTWDMDLECTADHIHKKEECKFMISEILLHKKIDEIFGEKLI